MPENHYSTTTAADWILHFHFFNKKHILWFCPEFFPHRKPNPRTSNPLRIYEEMFEMWRDKDENNSKYKDKLLNFVNKINKQRDLGLLDEAEAFKLRELFGIFPPEFLFPFVVRTDGLKIARSRRIIAGSGATAGSHEFLVVDLENDDCEFLFLDSEVHDIIKSLFLECQEGKYIDSYEVTAEIENSLTTYGPK